MPRTVISCALIAALAGAVGCGDDDGTGEPPEQFIEQQHDWPFQVSLDLDLLFVVDTSSSMAGHAQALADGARDMATVLDTLLPCKPSLHIGVVSADLGAGPYDVLGCSGDGDGGVLRNTPVTPGCGAPSDRFIRDVILEDGTRETNFDGSLADAMSCILPLPADGCDIPQPLQALRRALDGSTPENDGFLRPNAYLMVVLLTDGDDCSASDTELFDPADTTVDDPLGPLSPHRCFDFGVECDPDTPRELGAKSSCAPRADSPYLYAPSDYADFLLQLDGPWNVLAAAALGPATPVVVEADGDGNPSLAASCENGARTAIPAPRLAAFLDDIPQAEVADICSADLVEVLLQIAQPLVSVIGSPCLQGKLVDTDPQRDGIQPDCAVTETYLPVDAPPVETVLPACDDQENPSASTKTPCYYTYEFPEQCYDTPTELTIGIYPDRTCIPGARRVSIRCLAH